MALPTWSKEQIATQLDSGYHWSSGAILYRFPAVSMGVYDPSNESNGFVPLNTAQQEMASLAFTTWDDLIAKSIIKSDAWSNIDLGNSTTATSYAHAYFPMSASIWFNTNNTGLQHPSVGQYDFETFIHEIGHSLGLDHMGAYNGDGSWNPSCFQDSSVYSVMSYFGPEHKSGEGQVAWANWTIDGLTYAPQTPMLSDVMAIQHMYGTSTDTRTGNTVYGFHSNITGNLAAIYDFTQNSYPILTLFDSAGIDTLDLSGWSSASDIDLNAGAFSSCNEMTNNLCITYDCVIENLTTGDGADTLLGNAANNLLIAGGGNDQLDGGAGDDVLDGGAGIDTARYLQSLNHYVISYSDHYLHVQDTSAGGSGDDALVNVEQLQFGHLNLTEKVRFADSSATGTTQLAGRYGEFQLSNSGTNVVVTDSVANRDGITVYGALKRMQFDDLTVGFDLGAGESTGEVYRLYLAVLGRNPESDTTGCGYWIDKMDRHLLNMDGLVNYFLSSNEFVSRFGDATSSNESFVNLLYLNVLGRDGHPDSGFAFWQSVLDSNRASRAQVVVGFIESPENVANAATLIGDHAPFKAWLV